MSNINSNFSRHRLGRKQRHGSLKGRGSTSELRRLMVRTNDWYEVRAKEFVRVFWRDRYGLYYNFTISAAHPLNDKEVVALAVREYGLPSVDSVVMVQNVKHQYLVFV